MRFLKPDHVRSRTEKGLKRIPLQGVTLEPFALEGLFGFRLLPLPQARPSLLGKSGLMCHLSVAGIGPRSFPQTVLLLASRSRGVGKCSVRLREIFNNMRAVVRRPISRWGWCRTETRLTWPPRPPLNGTCGPRPGGHNLVWSSLVWRSIA